MAKAYEVLSKYYDYLQRDIDYSVWSNLTNKYLSNGTSVLEIGCGTGKLVSLLNVNPELYKGYDYSSSMIEIAQKNYPQYDFITADATTFKINDKFDLIICYMDTINYIVDLTKLEELFKNHCDMLLDNGYFIFDIHQQDNLYNFDGYLESGFIDGDEYRWYSHIIDERNNIVAHDFEFKVDKKKYSETHLQRLDSKEKYLELINKYFIVKETYDDDYRHYFILQKRRF